MPRGGVWMTSATAASGAGEVHFNFSLKDINKLVPAEIDATFAAESASVEIHLGGTPLRRLSPYEVYRTPFLLNSKAPATVEDVGCLDLRVMPGLTSSWTLMVDAHGKWLSRDDKGLLFEMGPSHLIIMCTMPVTVRHPVNQP